MMSQQKDEPVNREGYHYGKKDIHATANNLYVFTTDFMQNVRL